MGLKYSNLIPMIGYSFILYIGFSFLSIDEAISEEFFRVGWENYEGLSLNYAEKSYYGIYVISVICSLFFLFKFGDFAKGFRAFFTFFNLLLLLLYSSLYLFEGARLQEVKIVWITTSIAQVMWYFLLLIEPYVEQHRARLSKRLWLFQSVFFVALLGIGFYYWQWDLELVNEQRRMGNDHFNNVMIPNGRDTKIPEMTYHLLLVLASLVAISIGILSKNASKWLKVAQVVNVVLLLYSMLVYGNGYWLDMTETFYWWVSLCVLGALLAAILFWKTEYEQPRQSSSDLLDDFG